MAALGGTGRGRPRTRTAIAGSAESRAQLLVHAREPTAPCAFGVIPGRPRDQGTFANAGPLTFRVAGQARSSPCPAKAAVFVDSCTSRIVRQTCLGARTARARRTGSATAAEWSSVMGTRYVLEHGVGACAGSTQGRSGTTRVHGRLTGIAPSSSRRYRRLFGNRSGVIPEHWPRRLFGATSRAQARCRSGTRIALPSCRRQCLRMRAGRVRCWSGRQVHVLVSVRRQRRIGSL